MVKNRKILNEINFKRFTTKTKLTMSAVARTLEFSPSQSETLDTSIKHITEDVHEFQ